MSSQVNKSSVRFRPKVRSGPRTRHDSTARRGSVTINTNFSAPVDKDTKTRVNESAIIDDDEPMPPPGVSGVATPIPSVDIGLGKRRRSSIGVPEVQVVEVEEPDVEESNEAPLSPKSTPLIPQPVQPVKQAQQAFVDERIQVPTPMATQVDSQDTPDSPDLPYAVRPAPKLNFTFGTSTGTQNESLALVAQPDQTDSLALAQVTTDERTASDDELDEVFREPRWNEDGKEIIEPEDLVRFGKYNAKVHFYNKAINADTFTMAQLCTDIPVGDHDKDYYKYEALRSSRKRERALLLKAKQMVRGQHTPKSEQKRMELLRVYKDWQDRREQMFGTRNNGLDIDSIEAPAQSASSVAPKLVANPDGTIVLDAQSLQVDRHANNKADDENTQKEVVEMNKFGHHVNSYSFSNKERPERWTSIETETFYNAVSVWGTDFNLIAQFFPQRSRGQIKTKFKYEERRNPEKLRLYMIHRKKVRLEDIARISGKEIVPVAEIESELELVRREHAEQLVKENAAKETAIREDAERKTMDHLRRRRARGISGTSEVVGEITKKEEQDW